MYSSDGSAFKKIFGTNGISVYSLFSFLTQLIIFLGIPQFFLFFFFKKFGGFQTPFPGGITPGGMTTGFSTPSADLDLIKIGEARKSLVGVKLDQVCNCL